MSIFAGPMASGNVQEEPFRIIGFDGLNFRLNRTTILGYDSFRLCTCKYVRLLFPPSQYSNFIYALRGKRRINCLIVFNQMVLLLFCQLCVAIKVDILLENNSHTVTLLRINKNDNLCRFQLICFSLLFSTADFKIYHFYDNGHLDQRE